MWERDAHTAAVESDDLAVLPARQNDTPAEGITAVPIDQADSQQQVERRAPGREMSPQVPAGRIADAEFLDQCGIVQAAVLQIAHRLRMPLKLELIKGSRLLQQPGNCSRRELLLEVSHRLAEWQIEAELDKPYLV